MLSYLFNIYFNFRDYKLRLLRPVWKFIYMSNFINDYNTGNRVINVYDENMEERSVFINSVYLSDDRDTLGQYYGRLHHKIANMANMDGMLSIDTLKEIISQKIVGISYNANRWLYIDLEKGTTSPTIGFEEETMVFGNMILFQL
jgi:hypothetical protein